MTCQLSSQIASRLLSSERDKNDLHEKLLRRPAELND
jgi:hypothetical protein